MTGKRSVKPKIVKNSVVLPPLTITIASVIGALIFIGLAIITINFASKWFAIPFVIATDDRSMPMKHLSTSGTLLCITSGGCNPLDECLTRTRVFTCDIVPSQNHLLELKIAVIKSMPYDTFWDMFGKGYAASFPKIYTTKLRHHLTTSAQRFWDNRTFYFDQKWGGLYNAGSAQVWCAKRLARNCWPQGFDMFFQDRCFTATQQLKYIDDPMVHRCVKVYSTIHQYARYFKSSGVVPAQWKNNDPGKVFIAGLRRRATVTGSFCKDYVTRMYLTGSFSHECCPPYLRPENYNRLKTNVDRITILTGGMIAAMKQLNTDARAYKVDVVFPLDHLDCLTDEEVISEALEMKQLTNHVPPNTPIAVIKCVDKSPLYIATLRQFFIVEEISQDLVKDGSDMYMVQSAFKLITR